MRTKSARYGIKIFTLVCAKTFYTANLEVYARTQPRGPFVIDNSAQSVVEGLILPIADSSLSVTVDNWISSMPLTLQLLKKKITVVGTLKKKTKEKSPSFIETKHRPVNSPIFGFRHNCTIVSYTPK